MREEPERLRAREIGFQVSRWMSDPSIPDSALPASPDDVLWLLAEVERLARDNELLEACLASLERIMFAFGTEQGKSRDEMEARAERLVADAEQVERLAGRVAARAEETERRVETIRENVSHVARGCRAATAHNPAPYLNSIEAALVALLAEVGRSE